MGVAGTTEPIFGRAEFERDPGRKWNALDEPCPVHDVPAGTECPTGDFRRPVCADRMAWLRELIAAGEAGPGNELPTPDWRREMDLERGAKVAPRVAGGRITAEASARIDSEIIRLRKRGLSQTQIAESIGRSVQTVSLRISKLRQRGEEI